MLLITVSVKEGYLLHFPTIFISDLQNFVKKILMYD